MHKLLDAAGDTLALAVGDGLGGEVVGACSEAVVNEVGKELGGGSLASVWPGMVGTEDGKTYANKLLDLALLKPLLQLARLGKSEAVG